MIFAGDGISNCNGTHSCQITQALISQEWNKRYVYCKNQNETDICNSQSKTAYSVFLMSFSLFVYISSWLFTLWPSNNTCLINFLPNRTNAPPLIKSITVWLHFTEVQWQLTARKKGLHACCGCRMALLIQYITILENYWMLELYKVRYLYLYFWFLKKVHLYRYEKT